jgi:hypothetical protein
MLHNRLLRFVAILVPVTACWSWRATAQTPALAGGPMLSCSQLPCVDVSIAGGTHLKMLIDTGNPQSVLNLAKATELGIAMRPARGPDGKTYEGVFIGTLKDVRIGDADLGEMKVVVTDIQTDIQKGQFPASDGSLAYTAFNGRLLQLDYKAQRVGVSEILKADIACPGTCGDLTTPTFGKQGPPILVTTGFQLNGKPVTMQIDTLYSGTMLIYPTSVEKLGLGAESKTAKIRMFPYTDGGVDMIESVGKSESFGPKVLKTDATLYFAIPKVHLPDGFFDGTVGHELFAGHVLTMDFKADHFWIL